MAWLHSLSSRPSLRGADLPLTWWQLSLIGLLIVSIIAYGLSLTVEVNPSQVLQSSLQAGWNVLHDKGIYDEQLRPYRGPPLIAIAAAPFGNPSVGISDSVTVPYPLTRAIWFYVNVLCIWLATHWLVSLVETSTQQDTVITRQRWWLHRLLPLVLLIVPLTDSLQSGYADGVLLLVVAALIVGVVRRHYFASGIALAGAICLQFTSLVLLFIPIWRRDRVMSLGIVFGLLFTMLLLPGLMFGLQRTNRINEQFVEVIKRHEQQALADEQNHSLAGLVLQAIPTASSTREQWAIAFTLMPLTLLSLISCGLLGFNSVHEQDPLRLIHFISCLLAIMLLAHPLTSRHSYALLVPNMVGVLGAMSNPEKTQRWNSTFACSLALMVALISLPLHHPFLPVLGVSACWLLNAFLLYQSSSARHTSVITSSTVTTTLASIPKAA